MRLEIDASAVARSLSQVTADPAGSEVFLEAREETRIDAQGRPSARRESGLAVRVRAQQYLRLASEDELTSAAFERAFRSVAVVRPQAAYSPPQGWCDWQDDPSTRELRTFAEELRARLKRRQLSVRYGLDLRRNRRQVLIVGSQVAQPPQDEDFYALRIDLPWASIGRLSVSLTSDVGVQIEKLMVAAVRAQSAQPATMQKRKLLLSPHAAGVLFHEAVGHALEADVLNRTGSANGARGVQIAPEFLNVLDDPGGALPEVNRTADDEGIPANPRWLLRRGQIEDVVADRQWGERFEKLHPGCGRVSDRHQIPGPRIHHLSVLPGAASWPELLKASEGGLFVSEVKSGRLDAETGLVEIVCGWGRSIHDGKVGDSVGCFQFGLHLAELLARVAELGDIATFSGAGWCAKNGQKMPVWATTPPVLLEDIEVRPCPIQ